MTACLLIALAILLPSLLPAGTITGHLEMNEHSGRRSAPRYTAGVSEAPAPPPPPLAVVYLEGVPDNDRQPQTHELGQRGLQFETRVLPVRVGDTVTFPNHDEVFHNVFSYSPTKSFDLGRYRPDEEPGVVTFDKPGVIALFCEIHEHMRAFILVLETPYFVATDPEGNFRLEDVPAGTYTLKAWLNPRRELAASVTVPEEGEVAVTLHD